MLVAAASLATAQEYSLPAARSIDWSPGIPGGIPDWSGWTLRNVKTDHGAAGDGVADDTAEIQAAIDWAEANGPQVKVYFPAGTYRTTAELVVNSGSGEIVLYGDGIRSTFLEFEATGSTSNGIYFRGTGQNDAVNATSGYTKGSSTVTLADGSSFAAGDLVWFSQTNDEQSGKIEFNAAHTPHLARAQGQMLVVSSVASNDVTFARPLYYTYEAGFTPQAREQNTAMDKCGVESMTVTRTVDGGRANIQFWRSKYCWVKNVESADSKNHHIQFDTCVGCEVRGCYIHHGQAYTTSLPNGTSMYNWTSDTLIEDNIFYSLHHPMIVQDGATGNVIGYNYSHRLHSEDPATTTFVGYDMITHGNHANMNLFEGNIACKIMCDYFWGSNQSNTFFRCHTEGYSVNAAGTPAPNGINGFTIERANLYTHVVGCIIGRPGIVNGPDLSGSDSSSGEGDDTRVAKVDSGGNTTWHGNYDWNAEALQWQGSESQTLPDSFYLDSAPSFFAGYTWPSITPETSSVPGKLPAKERFHDLYWRSNNDNDLYTDYWGQYISSSRAKTPSGVRRAVLTQ